MSSTLERIDPDLKIPWDEEAVLSGKPEQLADYLLQLVKTLKDLLERITEVANYGIDSNDGEAVYVGTKNLAGEYPDGTWRFIKNGDNLERQVKISGTWTGAGDFERPI